MTLLENFKLFAKIYILPPLLLRLLLLHPQSSLQVSNDDPEKYQIHHHQMKIVFTLSLDNNGINYLNSHEN